MSGHCICAEPGSGTRYHLGNPDPIPCQYCDKYSRPANREERREYAANARRAEKRMRKRAPAFYARADAFDPHPQRTDR